MLGRIIGANTILGDPTGSSLRQDTALTGMRRSLQ